MGKLTRIIIISIFSSCTFSVDKKDWLKIERVNYTTYYSTYYIVFNILWTQTYDYFSMQLLSLKTIFQLVTKCQKLLVSVWGTISNYVSHNSFYRELAPLHVAARTCKGACSFFYFSLTVRTASKSTTVYNSLLNILWTQIHDYFSSHYLSNSGVIWPFSWTPLR